MSAMRLSACRTRALDRRGRISVAPVRCESQHADTRDIFSEPYSPRVSDAGRFEVLGQQPLVGAGIMVSERRGTDVVRAPVHVDALSVCRGVLPELQRADESVLTRARRKSAVRSGWLAAEAVLEDIGRPRSLALPQRPPDGVAAIVRALRVLFSPKGRQRAGASRGLRV